MSDNVKTMKSKSSNKSDFVLMIVVMIITVMILISFMFMLYCEFYKKSQQMAINIVKNEIVIASEKTNNTLTKGIHVVDTTANSIEYLMEQGASQNDLLRYITRLSQLSMETIDKNYTGLFGLFKGKYLDGNAWIPPADFVATERPWYTTAREGCGITKIVSPYLDEDTHSIIISMSKLLRDKESVLALDITLGEVTEFANSVDQKGTDFVYIVDKSGIVVSSKDKSDVGFNFLKRSKDEFGQMFQAAFDAKEPFEYKIDGKSYLIFTNSLVGDWKVIVAVNQLEVLKLPRRIVMVGTILIFSLIVILCYYIIKMFNSQKQRRISEEKQLALTQEHAKELQNDNAIINSLAGQFEYVCLINIVNNTISNYRVGGVFAKYFDKKAKNIEPKEFDKVIKGLIPPEEFDNFRKMTDRLFIIRYLQQHSEYSIDVTFQYEDKYYPYKFIFSVSSQSYTNVILGIKKV